MRRRAVEYLNRLNKRRRDRMSSLYQMWRCVDCGTERIWGCTVVYDPIAMFLLLCDKCGRHTKHSFFGHKVGDGLIGGSLSRSLPVTPRDGDPKENVS